MKLGKRLAAVAEFAQSGVNIADVGTDHGYIPIYLAECGHRGRLAASDVNAGPIESAKANAREAGLEDRIEFYLADGLNGIDSGFDTIIIAGMGGELIARILSSAPFELAGRTLVLQPQSKSDELVRFLFERNMAIEKGEIVRDMGKYYLVFKVSCGEKWRYKPNSGEALIPREVRGSALYPEYRDKTAEKYRRAILGLKSAGKPDENEIERLEKLIIEL
ncbi:MAG: SAM-dependent methyltransferase [Oscillospiraceae bacterium]|nr:SAM-dependent methyltransferase [Oscillospiraceae bacterium]